MTPREIIDRARAAYEAVRGPNEVPFDQRSRIIQEAWIKSIGHDDRSRQGNRRQPV